MGKNQASASDFVKLVQVIANTNLNLG